MKTKFLFIFLLTNYIFLIKAFAGIFISEIFPNTIDDKNLEYIELYNSGNSDKSLSGFILSDKIGKEYLFGESDILLSGEKKKYFRTLTKIILNNSDEELKIINELGVISDKFNYSSSVKGEVIKIIGEEEEIIEDNEGGEKNLDEDELVEGSVENDEEMPSPQLSPSGEREKAPEVVFGFQSATYLLEKDKVLDEYICDTSKEFCKINLDFRNSFTGSFSESDFLCETNFGFINDQENKCNPSTIIVPKGEYNFLFKIVSKTNINNFTEKNIKIINVGYIKIGKSKSGSSSKKKKKNMGVPALIIKKPEIIVESGLNKNKICINTKYCNLNLRYSIKSKYERCKWSFSGGTYSPGTQSKCNPGYVNYGTGQFDIKLRVYENGDYFNFEESIFTFGNGIDKIIVDEKKNIISDNIELKSEIIINKIMPNPKGSDNFEFIELKNNTEKNFNLKGCFLDDILNGGSNKYTFRNDNFILPGTTLNISKELSKINLNNTGDEVNLFCKGILQDKLKWNFDIKEGYFLNHERLDIKSGNAKVLEVIDGDTIKIQFLDSLYIDKLRLIGIDTPETKHPTQKVEYFGKEAENYVSTNLLGKKINIEIDENNIRDKYGRLLGYVFLGDENFNQLLIKKGYAKAYLNYEFKYKKEFSESEIYAKNNNVGMWNNILFSNTSSQINNEILSVDKIANTDSEKKLKPIITIQGTIGKNKILEGNTITCIDTCSINFDGSTSSGNIKKYSWNFGNNEKFDGKNPGYIKYESYGNYKVYLAVISDIGELELTNFNVRFIKKQKIIKTSKIINTTFADNDNDGNKNLENTELEKNSAELIESKTNYLLIILYIIIGIISLFLGLILLKKEKLI